MLTVTRFDNLKRFVSSVVVSDPAEIEYIDNDCVGDFQRGLWDDACDSNSPWFSANNPYRVRKASC